MVRFSIGTLCSTRGVADVMADHPDFAQFVYRSLARYQQGDWGEMSASDKKSNDEAVKCGEFRIFAAYEYTGRVDWKIWIITEADRSATTVLFPSEY